MPNSFQVSVKFASQNFAVLKFNLFIFYLYFTFRPENDKIHPICTWKPIQTRVEGENEGY